MKKTILFLAIFLTGCTTTTTANKSTLTMEAAISEVSTKIAFQGEIEKTVFAGIKMTETARPTSTSLPTAEATDLPHLPPINTPVPPLNGIRHSYETEYFLEMGACGKRTSKIVGNPKDSPNCYITSLEEISTDMSKQQNWTDTAIINPGIIRFCSLYHLENGGWRLVMTDIDYEGTGEITCHP